jgi:hypothetical protein
MTNHRDCKKSSTVPLALCALFAAVLSACGGGDGSSIGADTATADSGETTLAQTLAAGGSGKGSGANKPRNGDPTQAPAPAPAPSPVPAPPPASTDTGSLLPFIDITKIVAPAIGIATLNVAATTELAPSGDGAFRTACKTSHMAFDDPIVYPGQTGRSHLHTFFGNTGANAHSTAESLRTTGNSTCRGGIANRSAYWVPTMIDTKDGTPLVPSSIGTYYKNGYVAAETIQPIPTGLRMIAGTPSAAGPVAGALAMRFKCIGGPNNQNGLYGPTIGNCDLGAHLVSEVFFPQCWDGVNLDSPDHKSHMSYSLSVPNPAQPGAYMRVCPATHPVALPQVTFNVVYQVTEKDAPLRWRLSSDNYDRSAPGGYSSHGDWFNGWDSDVSDAWAKNCIASKKDCHSHLLGDGRMIF